MRALLIALARWLPSSFRDAFGDEVEEQIGRDFDRAAAAGAWATIGFTMQTVADLVWVAVVERVRPAWTGVQAEPRTKGDGVMRDGMRDLLFAARSLRRAPGFAATAVATLGLAIGVNAAIFAVVQTVLLDPLPYESPDRLVHVAASAPGSDFPEEFGVSMEFFFEYQRQTDLFENVSTYNSFTGSLRVDERVERVRMSVPTPTLFETLGVEPQMGRLPVAEDEQSVALISHGAWLDWFGGDPMVLGTAAEIMGEPRTIIGVMPPGFDFPREVLLWVPNDAREEGVTPGQFGTDLVARLAPGVEVDQVSSRLGPVAARLPEKVGGSARYARLMEQHVPVVRSLEEEMVGFVSGPLWVLFAAVAIVLVIACANVTNLFIVRSERRRRDFAVRRAIGAGWGQLARLQMAESVLIAAMAGVAAVGLAWVSLPSLLAAAPNLVPRLADAAIGPAALAFTFLVCVVTALACGFAPALRAARVGTGGVGAAARGATGMKHRGRNALVALQTSLALTLLVGSGLLLRSFQELRQVDPGYDVEDRFTFQIAIESEPGMDNAVSVSRFHLDFMDELRAMPGVESVGLVENVPLNEGVGTVPFVTEDMAQEEDAGVQLGRTWVAGDYFRTMGISLLSGRTFQEAEQLDNPGSVLVSEAAADALWPGQDPIGKRLLWPQFETWETVVGVVEDVMQYSFRDEVQPMVYYPLVAQNPEAWWFTSPAYVMRTTRADEIAPEVRALVSRMAPSAPMYRTFTMERLVAESMSSLSFMMMTLGIAAGLALVLGIVGLYGVLSYVVAERTSEIGLRMALGAQAERVRRMVVVEGIRVVAIGVVVGLAVSVAASRALGSLLFGVQATDPGTFVVVTVIMMGVGVVASYLPARRASSVDPVESLRAG